MQGCVCVGGGLAVWERNGLNGDLLPVLIMCRRVLCHLSHLSCAVKTKEGKNKYLSWRIGAGGGGFIVSLKNRKNLVCCDLPSWCPPASAKVSVTQRTHSTALNLATNCYSSTFKVLWHSGKRISLSWPHRRRRTCGLKLKWMLQYMYVMDSDGLLILRVTDRPGLPQS